MSANWTGDNFLTKSALEKTFLKGHFYNATANETALVDAVFRDPSFKQRASQIMETHFGILDHETLPRTHIFPWVAIDPSNNSFILKVQCAKIMP